MDQSPSTMKTFIFVLLLSVYCLNAQFFLQSTFSNPERNCDTSKPHHGIAVKKIFLKKKFLFDKCVKSGPSYQLYNQVNSTHFKISVYCTDSKCETCQIQNVVAYTCQTFPGQPFSIKSSSGPIPEIKKEGFVAKVFTDSKCERDTGMISFFSDAVCTNQSVFAGFAKINPKLMKSTSTRYNPETQHVETIYYQNLGCTGDIIQKQTFPINKCVSSGTPDAFFFIEKSFK
jgi:hypothetical protein